MQENEGKRQSDERINNLLLQALFLLFSGYEACFSPFLRLSMGSRYLVKGLLGGVAVLWLWVRYYPAEELILFGCVWLAAMLVQKILSHLAQTNGAEIHSDYGGDPALVGALPLLGRCSVATAWCFVEPGIVFLASYAAEWISPAMGRFFAWGSFVMMIHARLGVAAVKQKAVAMRDARIYGQSVTSYYDRGR